MYSRRLKFILFAFIFELVFSCLTFFGTIPVYASAPACHDIFAQQNQVSVRRSSRKVLEPLEMLFEYQGEEVATRKNGPRTFYIESRKEREQYQWVIKGGKFIHRSDGKPVTTTSVTHPDTGNELDPNSGLVEIVISPEFEIFGFTRDQNRAVTNQRGIGVHHSTFLAGQAVGFAGEVRLEKGEVVEFTNRSGHYMPDDDVTVAAIKLLMRKGISFDRAKISIEDFDLDFNEHRQFWLRIMPEIHLLEEAQRMFERGGYRSHAPPSQSFLNRIKTRVENEKQKLGFSPFLNRLSFVYKELPPSLQSFINELNFQYSAEQ